MMVQNNMSVKNPFVVPAMVLHAPFFFAIHVGLKCERRLAQELTCFSLGWNPIRTNAQWTLRLSFFSPDHAAEDRHS